MRVRAFGAIVGARHASPVKYAFGVYSVNALFTSYHEKIAHNANIHVMIRWARRASPVKYVFGVYSVNALFTSRRKTPSARASPCRQKKTVGNFPTAPLVGVTRFELATLRPPDVYSNRTELHPELFQQRKDITNFRVVA